MQPETATNAPAPRSFEEFFRAQYPKLGKALYVLTWSLADAEDLAQEAMARVCERWERVSVMEAPEGYVYRVAMNLFTRHMRSRGKVTPFPEGIDWSDQGTQADDAVRMASAQEALARLTPDQRAAVVLVCWLGLPAEDAAEILEIEPVSVRARIHRARQTLKTQGGAW